MSWLFYPWIIFTVICLGVMFFLPLQKHVDIVLTSVLLFIISIFVMASAVLSMRYVGNYNSWLGAGLAWVIAIAGFFVVVKIIKKLF